MPGALRLHACRFLAVAAPLPKLCGALHKTVRSVVMKPLDTDLVSPETLAHNSMCHDG